MPASGRALEVTFTPDVDGQLTVTVTFSAGGSGSDWGSGAIARVFCQQSGVTTYDGEMKLGETRAPYTLIGRFDIVGGAQVKCGLYGAVTGASSRSFYDINVRAEHLKR